MSSEGRVILQPLAKSSCSACGYGFHSQPMSAQDRDIFYDETYDLGLRDAEADWRRAQVPMFDQQQLLKKYHL